MRHIVRLAVLWTMLAAPVFAAAGDLADPAIAAGQEDLLAAMLGREASLPDGCSFTGAGVDYTLVKATYACPGGQVVFTLTYPGKATAAAIRTTQFALTLQGGSPPDSLTDALVALIRAREDAFEWGSTTSSDAGTTEDAGDAD